MELLAVLFFFVAICKFLVWTLTRSEDGAEDLQVAEEWRRQDWAVDDLA